MNSPRAASRDRWGGADLLRQRQGRELHEDAQGPGRLPDGLRNLRGRRRALSPFHRASCPMAKDYASYRPRLAPGPISPGMERMWLSKADSGQTSGPFAAAEDKTWLLLRLWFRGRIMGIRGSSLRPFTFADRLRTVADKLWLPSQQGSRAASHEHPVVAPQVSHFRQVPLRTRVKLAHDRQISPHRSPTCPCHKRRRRKDSILSCARTSSILQTLDMMSAD